MHTHRRLVPAVGQLHAHERPTDARRRAAGTDRPRPASFRQHAMVPARAATSARRALPRHNHIAFVTTRVYQRADIVWVGTHLPREASSPRGGVRIRIILCGTSRASQRASDRTPPTGRARSYQPDISGCRISRVDAPTSDVERHPAANATGRRFFIARSCFLRAFEPRRDRGPDSRDAGGRWHAPARPRPAVFLLQWVRIAVWKIGIPSPLHV